VGAKIYSFEGEKELIAANRSHVEAVLREYFPDARITIDWVPDGEDAELGGRYGSYNRRHRVKGKYEKDARVHTSLREWYKNGLWRGGAIMFVNTVFVPHTKRPMVANWRDSE